MKNILIAVLGIGVIVLLALSFFGSSSVEEQNREQFSTTTPHTPTSNQNPENQPVSQATTVQIALIALEDNGASGKKIGCNDSVVMVNRDVSATTGTLRAALTELLSLTSATYGESGFYNALASSDLALQDVSITDGVATVELRGQVVLGGTCDTPRFQSQLEETALQFDTVSSVDIFVNGEPLEEVLSSQ